MLRLLLDGDISSAILYLLSTVVTVFLILPFHEFAHAFVAEKLGDTTQSRNGRITLNPFAHIDWLGATMIMLFGFGWAKPVQVNPFYFKNRKWGMAMTALAGPVANLIAAFVSLILLNACSLIKNITIAIYVCLFFNFVASINIGLAVFNLIPIPPLDGSKILFAVLPDKAYYQVMRYEQILSIVLIAVIFLTDFLDGPMGYLTGVIYSGLNHIASLPFLLLA